MTPKPVRGLTTG